MQCPAYWHGVEPEARYRFVGGFPKSGTLSRSLSPNTHTHTPAQSPCFTPICNKGGYSFENQGIRPEAEIFKDFGILNAWFLL